MEGKPEGEGEKCGCGPGCKCKSAGCGGGCCGGRAYKAISFLLIGGILGYLIGGHCAHKKYCAMPNNAMMMTQPSGAPTSPPQK